jgi:hypothetical protein
VGNKCALYKAKFIVLSYKQHGLNGITKMNSIQILTTSDYRYHTDIFRILKSIEPEVKLRNWLLTDWESNYRPKAFPEPYETFLMDGTQILNLIDKNFQLIWGVLSGSKTEFVLEDGIPYSESNEDIWKSNYKIQNVDADIEILAWDSGYTLITSTDANLLSKIYNEFPPNTAFYSDCMRSKSSYYKGQSVNEMLWQSGFTKEFERAILNKNIQEALQILSSLGLSRENIDRIIKNEIGT